MNRDELGMLLRRVSEGELSVDKAETILSSISYDEVGDYAKFDSHRAIRVGYPEVIYCENKLVEQVVGIITHMNEHGENILATRATEEMYEALSECVPHAAFNKKAGVITVVNREITLTDSYIAVVSAGTSDFRVVEEATETAHMLGNRVKVVTDVGVAGIHRLFASLDVLRSAKVIVVVAGMEGALASVVGGLVDKPVIAVPTSVGYGANFGGVSALLSMLNSCASGVSVVNIDNGFGAAYSASMINQI